MLETIVLEERKDIKKKDCGSLQAKDSECLIYFSSHCAQQGIDGEIRQAGLEWWHKDEKDLRQRMLQIMTWKHLVIGYRKESSQLAMSVEQ